MRSFFWKYFGCCLGLASLVISAQAAPTALFSDADESVPLIRRAGFPGALRARVATMNRALLAGFRQAPDTSPGRLTVNLFPGINPEVIVRLVDGADSACGLVRGDVVGSPGGHFILAENSGVVSGLLYLPGVGSFKIIPDGDARHAIIELNPDELGRCGVGEADGHSQDSHHPRLMSLSSAGSPPAVIGSQLDPAGNVVSVLDVMVVYTPAAVAGAGGGAAIKSLIDLAVAESNTVYQNSLANARLRLVHSQLLDYVESDSISTNLSRLQTPGDGMLDEVHVLRETHHADLVCLITEKGEGSLAGLAFTMTELNPAFRSGAFSVVKRDSAVGSFIFAHEISHNLGCQHDRDNARNAQGELLKSIFPYSFGYRFEVQGTLYRDVMAYAPGIPIPFFSNPNLNISGVPLGVPDGVTNACDNVKTINATALLVSGFSLPATLSAAPLVSLLAPADKSVFLGADQLAVTARASDSDGSIRQVEIYTNSVLMGVVTTPVGGDFNLIWTNVAAGDYSIVARAVDELGASASTRSTQITVRPRNDDFSGPTTLEGDEPSFSASNKGATFESEETSHAGNPGGRSLWYSWVAPKTGTIDVVVEGEEASALVEFYRGDTLAGLARLARTISFDEPTHAIHYTCDVRAHEAYRIAVDTLQGFAETIHFALNYQIPAENDNFANRVVLSGDRVVIFGNNKGATGEPGEPRHSGNPGGRSLWYSWTPSRSGSVNMTVVGTNFFPLVGVYNGLSVGSLSNALGFAVAFDVPNSTCRVSFTAEAGKEYALVIDGFSGLVGGFTATLDFPSPPANDALGGAVTLSGYVVAVTGSNNYATSEPGEPQHAGNPGGHSVWYVWQAPISGPVSVVATGAGFFPLPDVYTGSAVKSLTRVNRGVAFNPATMASTLTFTAVAKQSYALVIDGFNGLSGTFSIDLRTQNVPPTFKDLGVANAASGVFSFVLEGSSNSTFVVQVSTNLSDWATLLTSTFSSNTFLFSEPLKSGVPSRFYRLLPGP